MTYLEIYRTIADLAYEQSAKNNTVREPTNCPYYNAGKTEVEEKNEGTDKVV